MSLNEYRYNHQRYNQRRTEFRSVAVPEQHVRCDVFSWCKWERLPTDDHRTTSCIHNYYPHTIIRLILIFDLRVVRDMVATDTILVSLKHNTHWAGLTQRLSESVSQIDSECKSNNGISWNQQRQQVSHGFTHEVVEIDSFCLKNHNYDVFQ